MKKLLEALDKKVWKTSEELIKETGYTRNTVNTFLPEIGRKGILMRRVLKKDFRKYEYKLK